MRILPGASHQTIQKHMHGTSHEKAVPSLQSKSSAAHYWVPRYSSTSRPMVEPAMPILPYSQGEIGITKLISKDREKGLLRPYFHNHQLDIQKSIPQTAPRIEIASPAEVGTVPGCGNSAALQKTALNINQPTNQPPTVRPNNNNRNHLQTREKPIDMQKPINADPGLSFFALSCPPRDYGLVHRGKSRDPEPRPRHVRRSAPRLIQSILTSEGCSHADV